MIRTPGAIPSMTALQIPTASSFTSKSVMNAMVLSPDEADPCAAPIAGAIPANNAANKVAISATRRVIDRYPKSKVPHSKDAELVESSYRRHTSGDTQVKSPILERMGLLYYAGAHL